MFRGMEQLIYRLARAGGIDTNPTTYTQRAGTFAPAVANMGTATFPAAQGYAPATTGGPTW
ncbi:hypothetical protein [Pseudarthrobacter sp. NIBRBAC000502770]|uniref:hypothetical protein n=1 Tax=Pseudarthrobacter sp. NIBRBAC000502770 TaxID=2590785 RepID=UPI001140756F|nr:hypothetical protein [Pseudarthrobacter sp. NIBRBAC000502770]QDG89096.1 hypothetical protein NIBR502770_11870 [Pseudarthrobacter sp. NIBRBAC000502770]